MDRPNLKHMRVFGCATYAHIRQDKLQPRAKKCIFLGFPHGVKAYKLWCLEPGEARCIISRDVTFNEEVMPWKTSAMNDEQPETSFEIELQSSTEASTSQSTDLQQEETIETRSETIEQSDLPSTSQTIATEPTELVGYQLTRDRTRRTIRPPARYDSDFVGYAFNCYTDDFGCEPCTYNEVVKSEARQ